MREIDRLPQLKIAIGGPLFLERVKEAVLSIDGYEVSGGKSVPGEGSMIELTESKSGKAGTIIRLISLERSRSIDIWLVNAGSDTPASKYLNQVRSALIPLLKAYQQRYPDKVRIHVPNPPLATRRPTGARKIFDAFGRISNKMSPNSTDWSYFYEFIIYCHDRRVKLRGAELRDLLLDAEFSASAVDDLVTAYDHGREILKLRSKARYSWAWARVIAKGGRFDV